MGEDSPQTLHTVYKERRDVKRVYWPRILDRSRPPSLEPLHILQRLPWSSAPAPRRRFDMPRDDRLVANESIPILQTAIAKSLVHLLKSKREGSCPRHRPPQ